MYGRGNETRLRAGLIPLAFSGCGTQYIASTNGIHAGRTPLILTAHFLRKLNPQTDSPAILPPFN